MTTQVTIKSSDMPEKIQLEAISQGVQAFFRNIPENQDYPTDSYQKIAEEIKSEFDKKYKKFWHCIVGENFGSFVTHESKTFIFFEIAQISVLLFKTA